jgi:hypothetical protein
VATRYEYLNENNTNNIKVYHSTNDKFENFSLDYAWVVFGSVIV